MKKILLFLSIVLGLLYSCKNESKMNEQNPFFKPFNTPFNSPDFTNIKTSDFKPAIIEGIKQQQEEIDAIVKNTEAPSFKKVLI